MAAHEQLRTLARGQELRLEQAHGLRIACRLGQLWLTQYGDSRDIVLNAGSDFIIDGGTAVIVSALRPSQLCLSRPSGVGRASVWRRFGQWLGGALGPRWQSASNARFREHFRAGLGIAQH
jgi:hypothetical protein